MYGYDAGVLGGVQATKPFLDAIGVQALNKCEDFPITNRIRILQEHMLFP